MTEKELALKFANYTTAELEEAAQSYRDELARMVCMPNLTEVIGTLQFLEEMLKERKGGAQ